MVGVVGRISWSCCVVKCAVKWVRGDGVVVPGIVVQKRWKGRRTRRLIGPGTDPRNESCDNEVVESSLRSSINQSMKDVNDEIQQRFVTSLNNPHCVRHVVKNVEYMYHG